MGRLLWSAPNTSRLTSASRFRKPICVALRRSRRHRSTPAFYAEHGIDTMFGTSLCASTRHSGSSNSTIIAACHSTSCSSPLVGGIDAFPFPAAI